MARAQYDLTILGGGSGGLTAARIAASLGANVLLIDKERLGGDCLNYGCVPSKSLIHVARVAQQARDAATLGLLPAHLGVDMAKVAEYIQGVIRRVAENEQVYTEGITVKFGNVSFNSATELTLNGERLTSRNTLVATGSHPLVPQIEGLEETGYVTNEHIFDLTRLPASLLVVGGGPIGVELGEAFARLGSRVTIIEGLQRIVPKEDPEISATLVDVLQSEGITIATNATFVKASRDGHKKVATAKQGDRSLTFEADEILVALGRRPNVEGLNLEAAGVTYTDKGIAVNDYLQTSAPNWAEIDRAQAEHETTGFIKLVLAGKKDEIVGAHMIGASAGELLGEISLAMQRRLTLGDILATIHAYPTMNTGIQQAALEAYLEGATVKNNRKIVRTLLSLRGR